MMPTGPRFDSKIETIKVIKSKISLETVAAGPDQTSKPNQRNVMW